MAPTGMTPDLCAWEVMETVPLVMRFIRAEMRQQGKPVLSVSQFRTLVFLNLSPGAPLCEVADYVGVTRPTASALVDRLVRDGLVDRVQHPRQRERGADDLDGRVRHPPGPIVTQHVLRSAPRGSTGGHQSARRFGGTLWGGGPQAGLGRVAQRSARLAPLPVGGHTRGPHAAR